MDQPSYRELDRRACSTPQKFLEQMMKQGQGERGEANAARPGREQQGAADGGGKKATQSNLPGKEPGKKMRRRSVAAVSRRAATQIKGMLGAGASSAVVFKGKPAAGKSALSQQSRFFLSAPGRAGAQFERVPEALKETIKNYFLSLGGGEEEDRLRDDGCEIGVWRQ